MFRFVFSIGLFVIVPCPRHATAQERQEAAPKVDKFVTVYGSRADHLRLADVRLAVHVRTSSR
ncbi:MAG: hypothetical protein DME98_13910 [Verrucomicrobia bacterium]|nr:MAG: hypothetical protein DME98_13910 [Verrucomicrobiota bacterium]PYJ35211.1 MAG: hypothetical protein DME88_02750 [Verrucomicrobiota bacterium]